MKQNSKTAARTQSIGEEIANSITHGIGLLLSIGALYMLILYVRSNYSPAVLLSLMVYGASLLFMYTFSFCYHSVRKEQLKRFFRRLDHIAIFLLIAGTYTPITALFLPESVGIPVLIAVWAVAVAGIVFKIFFTGRFKVLSVILYVGMGWIGVFILNTMIKVLPNSLLLWILAGGICYTAGLIFFGWKKLPYHHPVWHVFVLSGSAAHFIGIFGHLVK